jgi:catechol 2,3-dioxygenase-like lactoylglutathione lyase family enzyme
MLTSVNPKLPMKSKAATKDFYINKLGFQNLGTSDYDGYLMVEKDEIEIHFFEFKEIGTIDNYSGVYVRTDDIDDLYQSLIENGVSIHPNGALENKPWGQREFSLLDPDHNLLTFGQSV